MLHFERLLIKVVLALGLFTIVMPNIHAQMFLQPVTVYPLNHTPIVYTPDSLLQVLNKQKVLTSNCYAAGEHNIMFGSWAINRFDRTYIFDKKGLMIRFADYAGICASPLQALSEHSLSFYERDSVYLP